jgi:hypothetical protein
LSFLVPFVPVSVPIPGVSIPFPLIDVHVPKVTYVAPVVVKPEPKIEFFQQKDMLSLRMFLKNTGNCRVACKLDVRANFADAQKTIAGPCFLEAGESWELQEAHQIYFQRKHHKYIVQYVVATCSDSTAEKLLEIDATNMSFVLNIPS